MNLSALTGFASAIIVCALSVFLTFNNALIFLDYKSILIVVGGTVSVTLISFPGKLIISLLKVFLRRIFGNNQINYIDIVDQVTMLSKAHKKGGRAFEGAIAGVKNPFLRDAASVLFWAKSDVTEDDLRKLLETRAATHFFSYMAEAKVFRTIAKFPPAFGLMGTTLGLIALMQSLGGTADAKNIIGPAMAIALVTTLYGLAIANFVLVPISENLTKQTMEDQKARYMIVEGIMLIHKDMPTRYVEEHIKSFLLPSERGESSKNRMSSGSKNKAA